jgi:hypothetical protein
LNKKNLFETILSTLFLPIIIINILGPIIAGIWLAIIGEWDDIFIGIILVALSCFFMSFVLMPSLLFIIPSQIFFEKERKIIGFFFGTLGLLYNMSIMIIWCVLVMYFFSRFVTDISLIAHLLWSYGVALAPWIWLSKKGEKRGGDVENEVFLLLFAQISYLVGIILLFFGVSIEVMAVIFTIIMLVSKILKVVIDFKVM